MKSAVMSSLESFQQISCNIDIVESDVVEVAEFLEEVLFGVEEVHDILDSLETKLKVFDCKIQLFLNELDETW